jgi:hypothetical protein
VAETAWRNRPYYGDSLDVMRHDWCHGHELTARLGGWVVPPGSDPAVRAIIRCNGLIVALDDEGGYGFVGRT